MGVVGRLVADPEHPRAPRFPKVARHFAMRFTVFKDTMALAHNTLRKEGIDFLIGSNASVRRSLLDRIGGWDEGIPMNEEQSFAIKFARHRRPGEKFVFDPFPLMWRRTNVPGGLGRRAATIGTCASSRRVSSITSTSWDTISNGATAPCARSFGSAASSKSWSGSGTPTTAIVRSKNGCARASRWCRGCPRCCVSSAFQRPPYAAFRAGTSDGGDRWRSPIPLAHLDPAHRGRHGRTFRAKICDEPSPFARPEIALTFDDGPHPEWTPRVLDALDRVGAKATFFVVGRSASLHAAIVRDARRRGHEIGTHLYSHDRRTVFDDRAFRSELTRSKEELESLLGEPLRWLRFPYGERGRQDPRAIGAHGLRPRIGRTACTTASSPGGAVVARFRAGLRAGAIVLLHDALADEKRCPRLMLRRAT